MFINGKEQTVNKLSVKLWDNRTDTMLKEIIVTSELEADKVAQDMLNTLHLANYHSIDLCIDDDAIMQLV